MYLRNIVVTDCSRVKSLKGKSIKFDERINFLVGENGSGKSTILRQLSGDKNYEGIKIKTMISESNGKLTTFFFDSERMNPRTKSRIETVFNAAMFFRSHGECLMTCIEMIEQIPKDHTHIALLDEPESGISPWNQVKFRDVLVKVSEHCQVIVATHSLILTKLDIGQVIKLGPKISYHSPASSFDWQI